MELELVPHFFCLPSPLELIVITILPVSLKRKYALRRCSMRTIHAARASCVQFQLLVSNIVVCFWLHRDSDTSGSHCNRFRSIDWCCFYYFVRNSLAALREALYLNLVQAWLNLWGRNTGLRKEKIVSNPKHVCQVLTYLRDSDASVSNCCFSSSMSLVASAWLNVCLITQCLDDCHQGSDLGWWNNRYKG